MYGLIIKEKWLNKILSGEKTIEVRSTQTKRLNEKIYLIQSGSGMIMGECIITSNIILTEDKFYDNKEKHCLDISYKELLNIYKKPIGWELTDIIKYNSPIPYKHPQGAVIWVKIN